MLVSFQSILYKCLSDQSDPIQMFSVWSDLSHWFQLCFDNLICRPIQVLLRYVGISFNFSNEHKESVGSGVQTAEQQLPTMLRIAVHYAINIDELK